MHIAANDKEVTHLQKLSSSVGGLLTPLS